MASRIILVTGGARSGKSAFAERQLAALAGPHGYIATAEVYDPEMAERIQLHRKRRPASWQTYEVPRQMADIIPDILAATEALLVDCITVYISTLLYDYRDRSDADITALALAEMERIVQAIQETDGKTVIFVTNEIGAGIVPMEHVSRLYRDVVGKVNQYVASMAAEVYWTVCGISVCIKGPQCRLGGTV